MEHTRDSRTSARFRSCTRRTNPRSLRARLPAEARGLEDLVGIRVKGPVRRPDEGRFQDAAALEREKTIDIIDFVDPKGIDERYFETPYYLQAGRG